MEFFEEHYGSFLEGLMADHGAPQATPMCNLESKGLSRPSDSQVAPR